MVTDIITLDNLSAEVWVLIRLRETLKRTELGGYIVLIAKAQIDFTI